PAPDRRPVYGAVRNAAMSFFAIAYVSSLLTSAACPAPPPTNLPGYCESTRQSRSCPSNGEPAEDPAGAFARAHAGAPKPDSRFGRFLRLLFAAVPCPGLPRKMNHLASARTPVRG